MTLGCGRDKGIVAEVQVVMVEVVLQGRNGGLRGKMVVLTTFD